MDSERVTGCYEMDARDGRRLAEHACVAPLGRLLSVLFCRGSADGSFCRSAGGGLPGMPDTWFYYLSGCQVVHVPYVDRRDGGGFPAPEGRQ